MWKGWSPSRKLAAVVLLVAVVVAGAAAASSSSHGGASSASASNTSTSTSSKNATSSAGGQGGTGSTSTTVATAPPALPLVPTVTHTTGLKAGDEVTITVKADKGSLIYGVEMRMCRAGAVITNDGDWLPTVTGQCASKGLSPGADGYKIVPSEGDRQQVTATYKVGTGTDSYVMDDGTKSSVTCDATHPCELAVKYQIPNGFGFRTYPLTFS